MPDSDNQKITPKKPGWTEELSVEKRLLIAFALMGLVLFLTQYFYPQAAPQNSVKPVKEATAKQAVEPPAASAAKPADAPASPTPAAGQIAAAKSELHTIDTDVYKIVFSNHGAVVRSWQLKQYRDGSGKPLELVNSAAAAKTHYPFSLIFDNQTPSTDLNQALFVARPTADGLGIDFEYSSGRTTGRKTFRFLKNSYLSQVSSEVLENNSPVPHLLAWRGGFGDINAPGSAAGEKTLFFNPSTNKLEEKDVSAAKNGPVTDSGAFSFAGIEDTYFAAVALPKNGRSVHIRTLSDSVLLKEGGSEEARVGVAVGGTGSNQFALFTGPKDVDLLRRIDPKLEQVVDFGWFSFIAKPLFLAMHWLNSNYVHNYGWSIVLLTILINFLLLPLKLSGMKSMRKMSSLQPQIQAINEKYKNVGMRDPRKAEQNQEVMDLYKRHGVNPLGAGCMPLLLQIPFFFAFYKVLSVSIEMRGANWLWVSDLSQPETLAIRILPLAMIGTQFFLQKMTPPTPGADPAQQKMMLFMPLVMGFMFYGVSSGLVLYWLTGNLVGIVQQWFINKSMPLPSPAEPKASPVIKRKK
ncbi:MAG TPA: membrane protein insertase YidC [Bryobacteraceae bacterium]|nr:membrane protein insertase YidC [Bryobacteraceae bacterium]